jgi:methionyl-tRNA formyltransferase
LIAGETHTGVTLQTLHPEKFDHGTILAQTSAPGFEIPNGGACTCLELLDFITPKAAELLVQGIRDRVFVEPINPIIPESTISTRHAPKLQTKDRQIQWGLQSADELVRRDRALGRLWSTLADEQKRIIFEDITLAPVPRVWRVFVEAQNRAELLSHASSTKPKLSKDPEGSISSLLAECQDQVFVRQFVAGTGKPNVFYIRDGDAVIIPTMDGKAIRVEEVTVDGGKRKAASKVFKQSKSTDSPGGTFGGFMGT